MNATNVVNKIDDVIERLKLNFAPINVNYETHQAFHGAIQPLYKLSRELKNEMQRVETTSHWFANAIKEIDEMIAYHNKAKETAQGNFWYANHEICNNLHRVKRILINHAFQSNEGDENPDVLQFMQIILNNDKLAKCTVGMTIEQRACTFAYNEGFKAAMAAVNEFLMREKRAIKMTFAEYFEGLKPNYSLAHSHYELRNKLCTKSELQFQSVVSQTVAQFNGLGGYKATMEIGLDCKPYMNICLHNGVDENGELIDDCEAYIYVDIDDNDLLAIYAMVHLYFNDDCKKKVIELAEQRKREENRDTLTFINHADFLNILEKQERPNE